MAIKVYIQKRPSIVVQVGAKVINTGGGGAVDSVNGQTGVVVLDADNITETATRFWLTNILKAAYDGAVSALAALLLTGQRLITSGEITKLQNTSGTNTGDQDLSGLQLKSILVASNTNAVNDGNYTNVANATYTDPSPVEGKGFRVLVRNGTATVGGVGYSTAGTVILRIFHSGSWANYVYQVAGGSNLADFDSTPTVITGTTANTLVRTVAIPTDIGNCGLRITSLMRVITQVSGNNINRVSIGTSLGSSTVIAQGQLVATASSVIQGTFSIVGGASGSIKHMPQANLPFDFIMNRNTTVTNIDFTVQHFLFFSVAPANVGNVLEIYGTSVEKF